ncbi:MFS transporter [Candidatus Gromoviella agglomerans]|uniref:MFS transporter n=1 Tax=Candidatus Gromoviella agglomerans TaxID=2806609 RepID=UPI001E5B8501|nr:MFS transporter [Candidatus Gromoviella agglomerans]UFX98190.1 MFS transporter [Candidatus Gromoviella agglomerans]
MITWVIWACSSIFYSTQLILRILPNILLDDLCSNFSLSAHEIGLLASSYYVAYAITQLPVGILTDRFQITSILLYSISTCIVGSLVFLHSQNLFCAYIGRFLSGFGAGFALISSVKSALNLNIKQKYISLIVGSIFGVAMLFLSIILRVGARYIQILGWKTVVLYVIYLLSTILIVIFFIKFFQKSDKLRNKSISFLDLKCKFFQLFENKILYMFVAFGFMTYAPISCFGDLWGVKFIHSVLGFDHSESVLLCMMFYIGIAVGSILLPYLSNFAEKISIMILSQIILFLLFLCLILIFNESTGKLITQLTLFLIGICVSSTIIPYSILSQIYVSTSSGIVSSVYNLSCIMSGVALQPTIGFLINNFTQNYEFCLAIRLSFIVFCILSSSSVILSIFIKKQLKSILKCYN